MIRITLDDDIRARCPAMTLGMLSATVTNSESAPALWSEVEANCAALRATLSLDQIHSHPAIAATRVAYKRCGKDPNRYRPSAEALRRRVVQGKDLYRVTTLVDIVNLASLQFGFSIGAFDAAKVSGDLCWGIGREGEPYEGIGRGVLNIAGLPVLRDALGAIGTPTSDSERTKLTLETRTLILVVNAYAGPAGLEPTLAWIVERLKRHAAATAIETAVVT